MVSASDDHGVLNRRGLLRACALIAVAVPLAACTTPPAAPVPDPLQPLLNAADADTTAATAASKAFADSAATFAVFAAVRHQQAAALRTEVDRAAALTAPPTTSASSTSQAKAPTDETTVIGELRTGLVTAQQQATNLIPSLPTYRAGLVGSIAAGCASLAEAFNSTPVTATSAISAGRPNVAPSGGAAAAAVPTTAPGIKPSTASSPDRPLPADTANALQQALAAEHAALWLYGTASAFVTGSSETEIIAGMGAVQNLRDATERRLTAGGVTPAPAQPAYLVPTQVTNQTSALAALAIAESDATVAWRSVLEHTDDAGTRSVALAALIDSAVRQTRWRRLAGESPASVAMPGSAA